MKLYVAPGACSMSCHIVFEEAKIKFEPMISKWEEVNRINPMGAVPVLQFDDGKFVTQNVAIMSHAAYLAPQSNLMPKPGTEENTQAYMWLSWVASDVHPAFHPLFNDKLPEADRKKAADHVIELLTIAEHHLGTHDFLVSDHFTCPDAYLFTVFNWTRILKLPTENLRHLNAYWGRIAERPAVQTVMKREGLIQ